MAAGVGLISVFGSGGTATGGVVTLIGAEGFAPGAGAKGGAAGGKVGFGAGAGAPALGLPAGAGGVGAGASLRISDFFFNKAATVLLDTS